HRLSARHRGDAVVAGLEAPVLRVRAIELFERPIRLRLPFRFGIVTLREAPQAYARVVVELAEGGRATGMAAEVMAPKWFDKNPKLSNEQNFDQLRLSLALTADAYVSETRPLTAFALAAGQYPGLVSAAAGHGLNPLIASYGPALIDRAVIDALC